MMIVLVSTIIGIGATLQVAIGSLLIGTVLCLQSAGQNTNMLAIIPGGTSATLRGVLVAQPLANGQCENAFFAATVLTSGVLPSPLSGTTVCVTVNVI
jgi:hypothetical protein